MNLNNEKKRILIFLIIFISLIFVKNVNANHCPNNQFHINYYTHAANANKNINLDNFNPAYSECHTNEFPNPTVNIDDVYLYEHEWTTGQPYNPSTDAFSLRLEGNFVLKEGVYYIEIEADDFMEIFIDDNRIMGDSYNRADTAARFSNQASNYTYIYLTSGNHKIKINFYEYRGDSLMKFKFKYVPVIVPLYYYFHRSNIDFYLTAKESKPSEDGLGGWKDYEIEASIMAVPYPINNPNNAPLLEYYKGDEYYDHVYLLPQEKSSLPIKSPKLKKDVITKDNFYRIIGYIYSNPQANTVPLNRYFKDVYFINKHAYSHYYTIKSSLPNNFNELDFSDFSFEKITGYVYPNKCDTEKVVLGTCLICNSNGYKLDNSKCSAGAFCNSFGNCALKGQTADITPPTATVDPDGSNLVEINKIIKITFSKPMQDNSKNGLIFEDKTNPNDIRTFDNANDLDLTWNSDNTILKIIPNNLLTKEHFYSISFNQDAKDTAGNLLQFSGISFTTSSLDDTTPPTIESVDPPDNSEVSQLDKEILIKFSEPMEKLTVEQAFSLKDNQGNNIDGVKNFIDSQNFKFKPTITQLNLAQNLNLNEQFKIEFSKTPNLEEDVLNKALQCSLKQGNENLQRQCKLNGPDNPNILEFEPSTQQNLNLNDNFKIEFSEPIIECVLFFFCTYPEGNLELKYNNDLINGNFKWIDRKTINIKLDIEPSSSSANNLRPGKDYKIQVLPNAKDKAGNSLEQVFLSTFHTAPLNNLEKPIIDLEFPKNNENNVPINSFIKIGFSKAMDKSTVQESFSLIKGSKILGEFEWIDDSTFVFMPNENLQPDSDYDLIISTDAKDLDGNNLQNLHISKFKTSPSQDTIAPKIWIEPTDKSTNVQLNKEIIITFSEPMNTQSVENAITLNPQAICDKKWKYKQILQYKCNLQTGIKYNLIVSSNSKDRAGNSLQNFFSEFTTTSTILDIIPPTFTINDLNNLDPEGSIVITFSEPINVETLGSSFLLTGQSGNVQLIPEWNLENTILTLTPKNLIPLTSYIFNINPTLKDLSGNLLSLGNYQQTITFRTGNLIAPTLEILSPLTQEVSSPVNITLKTNKASTCRFSDSNVPYNQMPILNNFQSYFDNKINAKISEFPASQEIKDIYVSCKANFQDGESSLPLKISFKVVSKCGDIIRQSNEECDKGHVLTDFGGKFCSTFGYSHGTLSCNHCKISTENCYSVSLPKLVLSNEFTNNEIIIKWGGSPIKNTDGRTLTPIRKTLALVIKDTLTGNIVLSTKENLKEINNFIKNLFKKRIIGNEVYNNIKGYKINRYVNGVKNPTQTIISDSPPQGITIICSGDSCTLKDNLIGLKDISEVKYEVFAYNDKGEGQKSIIAIKKPNIKEFTIQEYSQNDQVKLNTNAEHAYQCRFGNSQNELQIKTYENYNTNKLWMSTQGYGQKEIYVQCKNPLGESSVVKVGTNINPKGENEYENGCSNNIDDDYDGIIDSLDLNCVSGEYVNVKEVDIDNINVLDNSEFEASCKIELKPNNPISATFYRAQPCVLFNISNDLETEECLFKERNNDELRFKCDSGFNGNKKLLCYINQEKCNYDLQNPNSLFKEKEIKVGYAADLCPRIIGVERLKVKSVDFENKNYDYDETLFADLTVQNLEGTSSNIIIESYLFNIKKELIRTSLTKEITSFNQEIFNLNLTIPKITTENNRFRLYFKIYLKDQPNEICLVESKDISINVYVEENQTQGDNEIIQVCMEGEQQECGETNVGICNKGTQTCANNAWGECVGELKAGEEICNNKKDDDCDGYTDCSDEDCSQNNQCSKDKEDTDNDGLSDEWELNYFGNLKQGPDDDFDKDGFTNLEEYGRDTNPIKSAEIKNSSSIFMIIGIVILILGIAFLLVWKFVLKKPKKYNLNKQKDLILVNYVKKALQKGYNKQQIKAALIQKGWNPNDIEEAFKYV
jgi:hypothetical protein